MWHCKHIGLFSTYIMNLDNGEKGSTTGLLDALNTSSDYRLVAYKGAFHLRCLASNVASKLVNVTTIASRRRAFH